MTRFRSVLVAPLVALLVFAPAAASAETVSRAEGSVPSEVAAYVADGSLVAHLNDVYGVNADGDGIDFDDTTKPGVVERVHVWSAEQRAGEKTEHPLDILNEWVVPITIADAPVGLATIWINPANASPELASFVADADLATALTDVPDGSSLVRDAESAAWLALAADGTLTPLVPGSTGLSTPVPLDDVALLPAPTGAAPQSGDPGTGAGLAIAVLLFLLAVIVVALVVPGLRSRKNRDAAEDPTVEPAVVAELEAAAEPETEPEKEPEPESVDPKPAPKKPATRKKKAAPPPTE